MGKWDRNAATSPDTKLHMSVLALYQKIVLTDSEDGFKPTIIMLSFLSLPELDGHCHFILFELTIH